FGFSYIFEACLRIYPRSSNLPETSRRRNKAMSIFPRCLFVIGVVFMLLAGCGEEEEEEHPYPGELINGTWTGSLISENTGKERSFEAILCYGEDPDILPPYYYDLIGIRTSSKIANADILVDVTGVFEIRSDDQVDTLAVGGGILSGDHIWSLVEATGFTIRNIG
ncbi:MAG: hypothetical protein V1800_17165, partial [Candidatus Latescibacterota bacterium]